MSESHSIVEYGEEIDAALKKDKTRLGDVFNQGDRSPEEIASELGVATKGFVYKLRKYIAAIREGEIPTATILDGPRYGGGGEGIPEKTQGVAGKSPD